MNIVLVSVGIMAFRTKWMHQGVRQGFVVEEEEPNQFGHRDQALQIADPIPQEPLHAAAVAFERIQVWRDPIGRLLLPAGDVGDGDRIDLATHGDARRVAPGKAAAGREDGPQPDRQPPETKAPSRDATGDALQRLGSRINASFGFRINELQLTYRPPRGGVD